MQLTLAVHGYPGEWVMATTIGLPGLKRLYSKYLQWHWRSVSNGVNRRA